MGRKNRGSGKRRIRSSSRQRVTAGSSLADYISQARLRGVKLTGAQRRRFSKGIQSLGERGKRISRGEFKKGRKEYGGPDYLATLGRTFRAGLLDKDIQRRFEKKGFTKDASGYYTKAGPITGSVLDKVRGAGFDPGDIRAHLAQNFANAELDDQIGKFLGEGGGYKLNQETGRWEKQELTPGPGPVIPPLETVDPGEGIFAGIDPGSAPGYTPAEMGYAAAVDPYKIEAKSRERVAALQAALGAHLGRVQAGSAERIGRASSQAEKDINRAAQAAELLGKKMAYGTEYDLAKVNRLAALQQGQMQQATSLYNLIPSAFG